ncbi:MAG: ABC transporter ATP-binding protein [Alphaproteobacteria bacterium]|nr:ABC transporter ATP-binding protein [Alphaproteobacteria bacterium]
MSAAESGTVEEPLLQVERLRTWFPIRRGVIPRPVGAVKAVDDVSFTVHRREVLGLAGESGSGKTTIGRSILRLIEPTDGRVVFGGADVTALGRHELRLFRRKAQIVFQDPFAALDPVMTIEEILGEPLQVQGLAKGRQERRDRVVRLLESVSLSTDFLSRRPHEMSGGQRQRIVIARALAVEPEFIVADEPVSALDVSIQAQIINLLQDLRDRFKLAMLFISHDIAVMEYLSDRIAVIYLGRLMEIGPATEICRAPKHPYTLALLSAVPDPDPSRRRTRIVLEGDVPNPADPPSGCVFRTRCPYALPACAGERPALRPVGPDRFVACIRDDVL